MEFLPSIPKMGARGWDEAPDYNIPDSLYKGCHGARVSNIGNPKSLLSPWRTPVLEAVLAVSC